MNGYDLLSEKSSTPSGLLNGHHDAREVVRLFQCPQCSFLLQTPTTLPCGNSLCRKCLPPTYQRENITYLTAGRREGFKCPFDDCRQEHAIGDCSLDVALAKMVDIIAQEVARHRSLGSNTSILIEEKPALDLRNVDMLSEPPRSRVLTGGRLIATYILAEMGELKFQSDAVYTPTDDTEKEPETLDIATLESIKQLCRGEADCQVCYALYLDPLTTACGHTFCRKCLARILDHSNICPICRKLLSMPPGVAAEPYNKRLRSVMDGFWADEYAARAEAVAQEETQSSESHVPLFVVTLAFPSMPTFLHVFEPRYRLMLRRAIETGDRKFGMVMYNQNGRPQGELGVTSFMQYGTLLHIERLQPLPDGRSIIECVGVSRFKIKGWGWRDGYAIGNVERVDDISIADEESLEAAETTLANPSPPHNVAAQLDRLPTLQLLQISLDFVRAAANNSASWLNDSVINAYGPPPSDPALFPYWFASVLPIADNEKYKLLPTNSVRDRLKLTARWTRRMEAARW